jgi:hypothetical protein
VAGGANLDDWSFAGFARRVAVIFISLDFISSLERDGGRDDGNDYRVRVFPENGAGRVLCYILALYGFAVFGYVSRHWRRFSCGRDAENEQSEIVGAKEIHALRGEIALFARRNKFLRER